MIRFVASEELHPIEQLIDAKVSPLLRLIRPSIIVYSVLLLLDFRRTLALGFILYPVSLAVLVLTIRGKIRGCLLTVVGHYILVPGFDFGVIRACSRLFDRFQNAWFWPTVICATIVGIVDITQQPGIVRLAQSLNLGLVGLIGLFIYVRMCRALITHSLARGSYFMTEAFGLVWTFAMVATFCLLAIEAFTPDVQSAPVFSVVAFALLMTALYFLVRFEARGRLGKAESFRFWQYAQRLARDAGEE